MQRPALRPIQVQPKPTHLSQRKRVSSGLHPYLYRSLPCACPWEPHFVHNRPSQFLPTNGKTTLNPHDRYGRTPSQRRRQIAQLLSFTITDLRGLPYLYCAVPLRPALPCSAVSVRRPHTAKASLQYRAVLWLKGNKSAVTIVTSNKMVRAIYELVLHAAHEGRNVEVALRLMAGICEPRSRRRRDVIFSGRRASCAIAEIGSEVSRQRTVCFGDFGELRAGGRADEFALFLVFD